MLKCHDPSIIGSRDTERGGPRRPPVTDWPKKPSLNRVKKIRAWFPEGQNNEQLGVLGDKKSKLRIFRCDSLLRSRY